MLSDLAGGAIDKAWIGALYGQQSASHISRARGRVTVVFSAAPYNRTLYKMISLALTSNINPSFTSNIVLYRAVCTLAPARKLFSTSLKLYRR